MTDTPVRPVRGRRHVGRWVAIGIGAVALALIAAGTLLVLNPGLLPSFGPKDLHGRSVAFDPGTTPAPSTVAKMKAVADEGERFVVPSVGLDVPLGALSMADGTITPPGFTSAYAVRNLGVTPQHAAEGTVFVAMHSLRGGATGPGNYLIDVADAKPKVAVGAQIRVAGVDYTVTKAFTIRKDAIGRDAAVWANDPGRLVVVTCLQRPDGSPSRDNVVITATLSPPAPSPAPSAAGT